MARMLTADLNLAHVEWVVQYRIKNPEHYLFKIGGGRRGNPVSNAHDLIGDVSEAVMRRITGDASVDSVITIGREQIASDAKEEMQQMLDGFEAGIRIEGVKLQSATPPEPVKDAFDAVNRAKQSKERVVNEAKGERNRLIPAARGKRDRAIAEAEGYALRVKMEAQGRANAFLSRPLLQMIPEMRNRVDHAVGQVLQGAVAQASAEVLTHVNPLWAFVDPWPDAGDFALSRGPDGGMDPINSAL